jgi:hypothetical protein
MLEMHDWFAVWQGSFTETDKTLEDWARGGSCYHTYTWKSSSERPSLRDVSKPWLRAIYHITYTKLAEEGTLEDSLIQVVVARRVSAG